MVLEQAAVGKHVSNIFQRLGLHYGEDNRRVRAILRYLSATGGLV
jgi:DNA-binding NarL/FixJ family response regulator